MIKTELGIMKVSPLEIAVVQRGIKFLVNPIEGEAKGYVLEVYKGHFTLPELGPIGSNCMANPQDF